RVAKLARWLVEQGIVIPAQAGVSAGKDAATSHAEMPASDGMTLADRAERAARLAKADLVTGMVGEFPELQGIIGGYLARAQGEPDAVADAIRDQYGTPTEPVSAALALADKLDTICAFFGIGQKPTGSKDPFALRRAAIGSIEIILNSGMRLPLTTAVRGSLANCASQADSSEAAHRLDRTAPEIVAFFADRLKVQQREAGVRHDLVDAVFALGNEDDLVRILARVNALQHFVETQEGADLLAAYKRAANILKKEKWETPSVMTSPGSQGIPQTGEEDPLVLVDEPRLREAVAELAGAEVQGKEPGLEPQEAALVKALDSAEPKARAAVQAEDFTGAMEALASLRGPIDAFFDHVTVNDPDPQKRERRLNLLARFRDAVNRVADFSRIEG
ncbi:MAG TPA: glycine--tRNA ligase subunit beta, partial [Burkholderiales bacterium]|nr:glycine--tRNA ligase subunit beta [Burkholderiales bacterium]